MKISQELRNLKKASIKANLTLDTALLIANNLKTNEEYQEMADYLIRYQKIMTEHQAIQQLQEMIYRREYSKD